jgi:UDP-N-acetylmuramate--alanine ligase
MSSLCFVNGDDELSLRAVKDISAKIVTFGLGKNNDYYADNISHGKYGFEFDVFYKGEKKTRLKMHIPGEHNILNGLAAFAVCDDMDVEPDKIADALQKFTGAGRRFEFIGEFNGFTLADDYAHHPTEIKATLKAAKELNYKRVIAVFQPFTFSRTALLKDEFVDALSVADKVILTPIMGSREVNTFNIHSEDIAEKLKDVAVIDGFENIADYLLETAKDGDIVITMGGGDIYKVCHVIEEK